ncbi:hypothetical protein Vretimale_6122 [Volvox reticuliferus]|uniref:Uncharacterized protein n=1 Tax=Volvox reticuliferus TaxID=1737510 RepID=A0A8J4G722_9CHLO|nr:hypothetical protein Vretifemale_7945 [Volvox reticuliferus]GIM01317.1 hypothetical protein Vretimale_6122 [Volvox reticuliferus]
MNTRDHVQACQEATDRAFLIAMAVPLLVAAAAAAYVLRPPPADLTASGRIFEDPATGTRFEAPEGVTPERDKNGELAFRPISYTPWPVDQDYEGERVRIAVGPVGARQLRWVVRDVSMCKKVYVHACMRMCGKTQMDRTTDTIAQLFNNPDE